MTAQEHAELVNRILIEYGSRPDLRLWKQASGVALTMDGKRKFRFGVKGWADIGGIRSDGVVVQIECKTGAAVQSKSQTNWQAMIERMGGVYIVARKVSDVDRVLVHPGPARPQEPATEGGD